MAKKNQPAVKETEVMESKTEAFVTKNKKLLLIALAVIIALIVGCFLYKTYVSTPRQEKASTALAKGQEYFANGQFDKALNGDGAGYAGLQKIISDYGSTDAGNLANLYAGLCYAQLDKWTEAAKYLEAFSPADDAMISPAAIGALGNAYAHLNQLDKAVTTLQKAADKADKEGKDGVNNSIAPTFRLQAAEIVESQGKDALQLYKDIKEKYVNSALVQSGEIDKYIERAELKKK